MPFHKFIDPDGQEYGSFEVFKGQEMKPDTGAKLEPGWYWWPCQPGCLPDGDPEGPFPSYLDAVHNARKG